MKVANSRSGMLTRILISHPTNPDRDDRLMIRKGFRCGGTVLQGLKKPETIEPELKYLTVWSFRPCLMVTSKPEPNKRQKPL